MKRTFMVYVRSLLFYMAAFLVAAVLCVFLWPLYFAPVRVGIVIIEFYLKLMMWLLRVICGLSYEVRGLEKLPSGGFICACNHQSAWETFGLMCVLNNPAFVLKKELRWVPGFWLYARRTQQIWIDRSGGLSETESMLSSAAAVIKSGRPMVIFPEGTRVPVDGHAAFRPGVVMLYKRLGVPCIPAAVNSGLFWPRKSWLKYPGKITLEFFDPIAPGLANEQFQSALEGTIRAGVQNLLNETDSDRKSSH